MSAAFYELHWTYEDDGTPVGTADTLTGAKDYALMMARDHAKAVSVIDTEGKALAIAYPGGSLEEL